MHIIQNPMSEMEKSINKYLTLKEEAHYYIQMRCTDKAGNVSEKRK